MGTRSPQLLIAGPGARGMEFDLPVPAVPLELRERLGEAEPGRRSARIEQGDVADETRKASVVREPAGDLHGG